MSQNTREELQQRIKELEHENNMLKQVNKARDSSDNYMKEILNNIPAPLYLKGTQGNYLMINKRYEELAHVVLADIVGKNDSDIFPQEVAALFRSQDQEVIMKNAPIEFEETIPLPDGIHSFITVKFPLHGKDGVISGVGGFCTDITEQKKAVEQVISASPAVIYRCGIEKGMLIPTFVSNNIKDQFGYDMADYFKDSKWWFNNLHPKDKKRILPLMTEIIFESNKNNYAHEYRFRQKDGNYLWVRDEFNVFRDDNGKAESIVGSWMDISEKRKMEDEIHKAQKLESIGMLAAGIAHDFNNYLAVILNDLIYIGKLSSQDEKISSRVEDARSTLTKAKNITQQLLIFSKGGEPVRELTSISALLKEDVEFFLRGSNVKPNLTIEKELWNSEVDSVKISQALSNIIVNANHAMTDGGTLDIEAENIAISDNSTLPLQQGEYLKISITDHGCGISNDDLQNIFDPYFTTKEGGTGLGLTTTYSIVKKHGGHINVSSNIGQGTTFTIYLPACDKELVIKEETSGIAHKEDIKVLLMEDEERLLSVVSSILQDCGYKVVGAKDGNEALSLFKSAMNSKEPFDAVVLDLTIPGGIGGKETIASLMELDRRVKAIVVSGHSNDSVMSNYKDYGFLGMLPKPYDAEELDKKIREILL